MKTWLKVFIPLMSAVVILAFLLIFPVIIWNQTMLWFWIPLAIFGVIGIVILIIYLINRAKKVGEEEEIDLEEAKAVYRNYVLEDDDNPDNIRIYKSMPVNIGERGRPEKTPIAILWGIGSEMNQMRIGIINMKKPKKKIADLTDPTDEEIWKSVRLIADFPPEEPITEKTITQWDRFNRPQEIRLVSKPPEQTKEEEEKKKLEDTNKL